MIYRQRQSCEQQNLTNAEERTINFDREGAVHWHLSKLRKVGFHSRTEVGGGPCTQWEPAQTKPLTNAWCVWGTRSPVCLEDKL